MDSRYEVIDLFAGPGGLAEGFSALRAPGGERIFEIAHSVERDAAAHSTLRLRAFLRCFSDGYPDEYYRWLNKGGAQPDWSALYPEQWERAEDEALLLELGDPECDAVLAEYLAPYEEQGDRTIIIGGPPCQAYSLVGRSRRKGVADYVPEEDERNFLYREYISLLDRLRPAAFVMENVKGLISSTVKGARISEQVLRDLAEAGGRRCGYVLIPLRRRETDMFGAVPDPRIEDFVIEAEQHGVPQARHRIIIVGVRRDLWERNAPHFQSSVLLPSRAAAVARSVLTGLPVLRSRLSREADSDGAWREAVVEAFALVQHVADPEVADHAERRFRDFEASAGANPRASGRDVGVSSDCPVDLADWIVDERIEGAPNHEPKSHMRSDLARYLFVSLFGEVHSRSPKSRDFPEALRPDHASWSSGNFADRFRVQLLDAPSTTITSHISKDGHYFIHPDPLQCRSLTVREAARLQTFPDNYVFLGNRTEQYVQVGNAVPPFLARSIAEFVSGVLEGVLGRCDAIGKARSASMSEAGRAA